MRSWGFLRTPACTPRGGARASAASRPSPEAVPGPVPGTRQPSSASRSPRLEEHWGLTGHWTPRGGRGGEERERGEVRPRKRCWPNSKDSGEGITLVLIYSTSSITLLLLLTPGDLFNCFGESQYCHFITPRLPLLLIKKKKEGKKRQPPAGAGPTSPSPGGPVVLAAAV